jgi:hypothetical protein
LEGAYFRLIPTVQGQAPSIESRRLVAFDARPQGIPVASLRGRAAALEAPKPESPETLLPWIIEIFESLNP